MDALTLDLKHRVDHLEGEVARLKPLAEQAVDLRDRIDALMKILLQNNVVSAEEAAAMLLARRGRRRKKAAVTPAMLDDIQQGRTDLASGLAQPLAEAFDDVRRQLGLEQ